MIRGLYESSGVGRRSVGYIGTFVALPGTDSIVHGVDGHYLSPRGKFAWDGQLIASDVDSVMGYGGFNDITYTPRTGLSHRITLDYFDEDLDVDDLGFIRRNDAIVARYGVTRSTSRGLDFFRQVRNSLFFSYQSNVDGFANRVGVFNNNSFMFKDRSEVKAEFVFQPAHWDDRNSRGNGMFKVEDRAFVTLGYGTDSAKKLSWSGQATTSNEDLGDWGWGADFGFTYRPADRFSVDLDLRWRRREGWLVHRGDRDFTTYGSDDFQPRLAVDFFITARQQLRMTMQWAGIRAEEQEFWQVPVSEGDLIPRVPDPLESEDFTISRLFAQVRYRWEIGPLSDLFVVYNRGSNVNGSMVTDGFDMLFDDALQQPVIDFVVVKLRYRFGT